MPLHAIRMISCKSLSHRHAIIRNCLLNRFYSSTLSSFDVFDTNTVSSHNTKRPPKISVDKLYSLGNNKRIISNYESFPTPIKSPRLLRRNSPIRDIVNGSLNNTLESVNTHIKSPLVAHLRFLRRKRIYREEYKEVYVQGSNVIQLLESSANFQLILTCNAERAREAKADVVLLVPAETLSFITECEPDVNGATPDVGILPLPQNDIESVAHSAFILALDGLIFADNVGKLLVTARSYGIGGVVCTEGCADLYNWKTIEVSNGLSYLMPSVVFSDGGGDSLVKFCKENNILSFVADKEGVSIKKLTEQLVNEGDFKALLDRPICLAVGNEAKGPSSAVKDNFSKVSMPQSEMVESLNVNVAASLILYQLRSEMGKLRTLNGGK